jgi:glycosyltransferase involved in cell wall biosynthesis
MDTYKKADVILCPQNPIQPAKSHIKVITAFALEKPVICSHHPAYEEIVKDGWNGFFYNQPSDLIDIIDKLRDKELIKKLGQNGYNSIIKEFNPKFIADKLTNYICSDLNLPHFNSWVSSTQKSGLRRIRKQPETLKVDVVYVPLPTKWQSYGDFVFEAFLEYLGADNVRQHNTLNDMIEFNNKHGWNRDLFVFIEFNPDWYNIPKEILSRSIMYGWDTHGHYMFSHLYNLCRRFNRVYISGKEDVGRMYASGLLGVRWIPEAHCDRVHKVRVPKLVNHRIIFVGQIDQVIRDAGGMTRYDYLNLLSQKYKDKLLIIGNVYGNDYCKLVTESYVSLDLPIAHNIGTRLFESNAMGVVTLRADNKAPGFDDYFRDGVNVLLFEPGNIRQLCDKIDMILSMNVPEISGKGYEIAMMSKHQSYENRVAYILEDLGL